MRQTLARRGVLALVPDLVPAVVPALVLAAVATAAVAQAADAPPDPVPSASPEPTPRGTRAQLPQRLCPLDDNTAVWRWAEHDDAAWRFRYSMQYLMMPRDELDPAQPCRPRLQTDAQGRALRRSVYASFDGEMDFYMFTRPSVPVVLREVSAGLHLRYQFEPTQPLAGTVLPEGWTGGLAGWQLSHWDWGVEHRSNGQGQGAVLPADVQAAQQAWNRNDHAYFDRISRGANAVMGELGLVRGPASLRLQGRLYFADETQVTWGPWAGRHLGVQDYHRLRALYSRDVGWWGQDGEVTVTWTVGDKALATDSFDLGYLVARDWLMPLYLQWHHGPMASLSNYTQPQDVVGVGVKIKLD